MEIISEDTRFRKLKDIPFPTVNMIWLEQFANESVVDFLVKTMCH